ncbi:ABC transporter permease [Paracoccus sp. (in: a-proteobacteria)]|uniref:ABC transporter permease n=1 Tax=Paracoccus sp. TaxID=267 RepID=UPI003A8A6924
MLHSRFNWPGFLLILAVVAIWEVMAQAADSMTFPSASGVVATLFSDTGQIMAATLITLRRAAIGFGIALALMLPAGIVLGRIRTLGEIVEPVIEFFRPLPPIAVVPLAMMILGIGDTAKLVVIVWGASFPILINTIDAVKVQDPMQARLARSLRLTTIERMTLIDLPAALPRIFAGIRLSITVSLLLTVVSEIILSTDGLGDYLKSAQSDFDMTKVMTAIIVIAIMSLIVNSLTNIANQRLLSWHFRRSAMAGI